MFPSDLIFGFFLISEIIIGLMGNALLFTLYMYTFLIQPHLKKPIDVIFTHLTLVNILTIVFRSIPDIMTSFGVRFFFHDVSCKAVLYAYSVTRGLSICTTSLLSAFQAIIISPSNSKWAWLKPKLSSFIFPSFFSFWIINMCLYIPVIESVRAKSNFTIVGSGNSQAHCQSNQLRYHTPASLLSVMMIRDLLFVVFMIWTSLYMVNLLFGHRKRAQHVHSPGLSSQTSPENKATHSILLLVGFFLFFYFSNNCITFYVFCRPEKNPVLDRITRILSSSYPIICPYVLMNNRKIISKFISSLSEMRFSFSQRGFNG